MKIKDIAFYSMILVIVFLSVYLIWFVNTESYKCIANPLIYGVGHLSSSNDEPVTCSCSFKGSTSGLIITKDNITESLGILDKPITWNDLKLYSDNKS